MGITSSKAGNLDGTSGTIIEDEVYGCDDSSLVSQTTVQTWSGCKTSALASVDARGQPVAAFQFDEDKECYLYGPACFSGSREMPERTRGELAEFRVGPRIARPWGRCPGHKGNKLAWGQL